MYLQNYLLLMNIFQYLQTKSNEHIFIQTISHQIVHTYAHAYKHTNDNQAQAYKLNSFNESRSVYFQFQVSQHHQNIKWANQFCICIH